MEVKPGYKQTEVGVIPEEWEVGPLESVARIIDPQPDHRTPPETAGGEPYIGISDFIDDCTVNWDSSRKIVSRAVDKQLSSFQVQPGNIIFGKIGTIGSPKFLPNVPFRFGLSANVLLIQPRIESNFVMSWLRSKTCQRAVTGELHSTSQAAFGINKMRRVMIPLPPEPEQRAIATALSDVDGLLGGLDRLIAKKRDLKQAAMQQLLTGQTRLPGFHGEWEVKRLKQAAEISTGINKPLSEMGSGALYVTVQDLYDKTSIRTERLSRIKVSPSEIETRGLTVGDIVFGKSSVKRDGIGYPSQFLGCDEPVVFSGFTYRARARQGITDATFLFYALREEKTRRWLIDNSQASALTNINQTIADAIPVKVPPNLPEQTAIAEVLSDMDAELAALEQRRDKTRALKQAMMQELLTGKTRLIAGAEAEMTA